MGKSIPRFKTSKNGRVVLDGSTSTEGKQAPSGNIMESKFDRPKPKREVNPIIVPVDPEEAERKRNELYDKVIAKLDAKKAIEDAEKAQREAKEKAEREEMIQLDLFEEAQ